MENPSKMVLKISSFGSLFAYILYIEVILIFYIVQSYKNGDAMFIDT